MKNITALFRAAAACIIMLSLSLSSSAQIATVNGSTSATLQAAYSLSSAGYINNPLINYGQIEIAISNTLPTCTTRIVAYRASSATFAAMQNTVTSIAGSTPTNGIYMLPWSTPQDTLPYGINYNKSGSAFFKSATGFPQDSILARGKVNANGVYGLTLGFVPKDTAGNVDTTQEGFYVVKVFFTNSGVTTTQGFYFTLQSYGTHSQMETAIYKAIPGNTSCTNRGQTSSLNIAHHHMADSSIIVAQLFKNNIANGSAVNYIDPNGGVGGGTTVPFSTLPSVTSNGYYYVRFMQNFRAVQYNVNGTLSYPWGGTFYAAPVFSPYFYEVDMTGTSPVTYSLVGTDANVSYTSNTVSTFYKICQKTSTGGTSPLVFTLVGTNSSATITSTATISRYTDSTYTTLYSPTFSQTLFSGTGGWDGTYDLTSVGSAYLASNSGYYKFVVTSSASSCGSAATSATYYFYWAGPPSGALSICDRFNAPATYYLPNPSDSCNPVSTYCAGSIQVGNPSTTSYTGTLSGIKFILERMTTGTCSTAHIWDTIVDGTAVIPTTSNRYPQYTNSSTGSWNNFYVNFQTYCSVMQANYGAQGCSFRTNFINAYVSASSIYEWRLTCLIYNNTCGNVPTIQKFYLKNVDFICKNISMDDETTGIAEESIADLLNVFPNPATSTAKLVLPQQLENATISLYDMQGREINIPIERNSPTEYQLNFNGVSKGIYTIGINNRKISKRITIN